MVPSILYKETSIRSHAHTDLLKEGTAYYCMILLFTHWRIRGISSGQILWHQYRRIFRQHWFFHGKNSNSPEQESESLICVWDGVVWLFTSLPVWIKLNQLHDIALLYDAITRIAETWILFDSAPASRDRKERLGKKQSYSRGRGVLEREIMPQAGVWQWITLGKMLLSL